MEELLKAEAALLRLTSSCNTVSFDGRPLNDLPMMGVKRIIMFRTKLLYIMAINQPKSNSDIITVLSYIGQFID